MKIAAFFSDSPFASWGQARGFASVLRRMGHEVVDIPIPPGKQVKRSQLEKINKPIDDCELVIVSGPEHLKDWINQFYPQWKTLKMPKVGWYHESFHARDDYQMCFQNFEGMFDLHCFPDKDDAAKYGGHWLPLGVDTEVFREWGSEYMDGDVRCGLKLGRDIDCAFIGLMYPKRQRFYEELRPFLKGINLRVANGNILVHDFDGINLEKSTELLAETYRRIKVFVAFPSVCNVLVAKILESMASGCYLVAEQQPANLQYYSAYTSPKDCAFKIRKVLERDSYRERGAKEGCQEVHKNHRMELRFEEIFKLVGESSTIPLHAESPIVLSANV